MRSFRQHLEEKVIVVGKGARYGQVIFLAGGAGSGKGFAISNFLEGNKYKVRDVDAWKSAFLKLSKIKKKYSQLRRLNLRKPKDVLKLHTFIKDKGIKDKTLDLMLGEAKEGRLPNLIFDVTLKGQDDVNEVLPSLLSTGYSPSNINIVWVLTNYHIAVQQNEDRPRVVPDKVMLLTHEGASQTMYNFIKKGAPRGVNGAVHVILGGKKHTVFYTDPKTGKPFDGSDGRVIVKDFKYITLKQPGKAMTSETAVKQQVIDWIRQNAPKTKKTQEIFGTGRE